MAGRLRTARLTLATALVLLIGVSGCSWVRDRETAIESGSCSGCNLLLVTIDTLRADRVGAFGSTRHLTPNLDRLANESVRLTRAYASAPLTLPSHTSILTAVSPPVHGVRTNGLFRLGPSLPTLATIMHDRGYRTGAFVGAFVLDARFGLNRGFDEYDDRYGEKHEGDQTEGAERRAEDVVKPAIAWIDRQLALQHRRSAANQQSTISNAPWFAWVHLYDPHEPYRAPEPYASQHDPYDAEVAYTDAMVGRLLDNLRDAGQLDRTVVIATGDHGESLGEHGERTHGLFVYDVTMRVPWFIWTGHPSGRDMGALARLIDLAPTALDLLGIAPPTTFEGRSLLPAVDGRAAPPATAYIEAMDAHLTRNSAPLTGLVSGSLKLIDLPIPELYDLAADPGEMTNLFARETQRPRVLGALLRDTLDDFAKRGTRAEQTRLGEDARRRLLALGYVGSTADNNPRVYTANDDPKTLIGPANGLNAALADFNRGARAGAMAQVRAIMSAYPGFSTAFGVFASMQWQTGDRPGAIETLESLVRRGIADQSVMVVLAGYLQETGAFAKAVDLLETVIAAHPDYAEAYNSLAVVYSRMGRHAQARQALAKVLDLDPTSATAYENRGVDDLGAGDLASAEIDLHHALDLDPHLATARNALAAVYMRQHRPSDAIAQWKLALRDNPGYYDALFNLGMTLDDLGEREAARPYLQRFINDAPPERYAADIERIRRILAP